jgi:hypothetical protein
MTKNDSNLKIYGFLPPKIAESDISSLGHGLCGSSGTIPFTITTPANTHSLLELTMIDPATGWFAIVQGTNKSERSIQDLIHNTWLAHYQQPHLLSLTMGANSNLSSNKCVCKTIMAIKPNQLQVTTSISSIKCNH